MRIALFVLGVLFLAVVLPRLISAWSAGRRRDGARTDDESARQLAEMTALARRLEDRINHLERILDQDSPQWRRQA